MAPAAREALAAFFRPRRIALVGASDRSAWSRMTFSRFAAYGHQGELFAVNRTGAPAHGLPGFTRIGDIPGGVDLAYIYVPAEAVAGAVREAGAAGVRHAVVLSSGFAEAGEAGAALQAELAGAAEDAGVLLLGPNSLGFANIAARCACTSIPTRLPVLAGRLAVVSQSGALANEFAKFAHTQGIGLSFIGATGNEAQLGVADMLDYLVDDPSTGAVAVYVEAIHDPARFAAAAERARCAAKPVVVLKVGRSATAAAVAQAHTGSLVGDDKVFDAMLRHHGVTRTSSIEELILTADLLGKVGPIDPPRIGMASISGGACGLWADLAELHGLAMPPFAETTQAALRGVLPDFAATLNPLDVTGMAVQDPTLWARTIPLLAADPGLGLVVTASVAPNTPAELAALRAGLEAVAQGYRAAGCKPVLCNLSLQEASGLQRDVLTEVGIEAVLPDLDFGVRALAHLQRWSERLLAPASAPLPRPATSAARPRGERETLAHLAAHGVPVVPAILAAAPEAAARAAERLGGRLALKVASPDIAHKTEAGGVRLGVEGPQAAREAFAAILSCVRAHAPDAQIEGVLVQPMREAGVELIVGVARDPEWGPAIVVGLGGLFTEALQDSQTRLLPIDAAEARRMLGELKGARLLQGFRGAPPADLDRLCAAIVAVGEAALALGPDLAALEVNPLWVRGEAVECLDALALYSTDAGSATP